MSCKSHKRSSASPLVAAKRTKHTDALADVVSPKLSQRRSVPQPALAASSSSPSPVAASVVAGYTVMPVPLSTDASTLRYIYYKQHAPTNDNQDDDEEFPPERTVFVTNLTFDASEADVRRLFEPFGVVERVDLRCFSHSPASPSELNLPPDQLVKRHFGRDGYAFVVFEDAESLAQALRQPLPPSSALSEQGQERGVKKWLSEFRALRPDPKVLQQQADDFMAEYDARQAQKRREDEQKANQPDADGFVTVVRRGKKMAGVDTRMPVAKTPSVSSASSPSSSTKPKEKVLHDFYRFQKRQQQRELLADLRKRFEADKQRIARMKANRKFKG